MTRITNALRDAIVRKAIEKAGLNAKRAEYDKRRSAWAEAVRIDGLGGPVKAAELEALDAQICKLQKQIPEALSAHCVCGLDRNCSVYVNIAGSKVYVSFGDSKPFRYRNHVITADNPLAQQFYDLEAEEKALDDEQATLSAQVRGALSKFNTVKRLLDAWPEVKELLPDRLLEAKPTLPAIRTEDLNALIGLPSEEAAAQPSVRKRFTK